MKIYASTDSNWWEPYVGKDVWVYCWCFAFPWCCKVYIRIIDVEMHSKYQGTIIFNLIKESDLVKGVVSEGRYTKRFPSQDLRPIYEDGTIRTLKALTQLNNNDNDIEIFEKFVGKPFWMSCMENTEYPREYFVKILEYDDNDKILTIQYVLADFLIHYEADDYDTAVIPSHQVETGHMFIDQLTVCKPLDLLSDAEIKEFLAENDSIYYQHNAIYEDEDE